MDIEALIYALGVVCILSAEIAVIAGVGCYVSGWLVKKLARNLWKNYKHAQLEFFMRKLIEKGYRETKKEADEKDFRVMPKEN